MFNFSSSFEDMFGIMHSAGSSGDREEDRRHYIEILFNFKHLNDFEVQFMDDSEYFLNNIKQLCINVFSSTSKLSPHDLPTCCTIFGGTYIPNYTL